MYIKVRVTTGAKKESFKQEPSGRLLISVKEAAENNMANLRVITILAEKLSVPKNKIRFVSGERKPSKIFRLEE